MRNLLIVLLLISKPCFPQAGRAELLGAIQDPSGLPVSGATVEAEDQATMVRYSALSSERGEYHILGLPAGSYTLTVKQPGFHLHRQSGITLRLADRTAIDVKLEIGQPTQSVEVTAAASLLQTASGEVSLNVDERRISTLPLDGRNFIPLVTLSPGVALPNGQFLPRINGSRPRTNEYIYDGISVLQPEPGQVVYYPIIDGMDEFKLNVNAYSPEYGRSNGGTVMVIGKSGSNQFHGSLFEFFRNEALNARNLFAQPGPTPEFRRNQYGADAGRPDPKQQDVLLRGLAGHAAAHRHHALQRGSDARPTAGNLHPGRSSTRQPRRARSFPNNTIPGQPLRSRSRARCSSTIRCRTSPDANNYVRTATEPDNQDQADFRLDRYFGERHRVFGRYTYFRDDDTPVTPLPDGSGSLTSGVIGHAITRGDAFVGDYNWVLSPTCPEPGSRRLLAARPESGLAAERRHHRARACRRIPSHPCCRSSRSPAFSRSVRPPRRTPISRPPSRSSWTPSRWCAAVTRIKVGVDLRREALDVLEPAQPNRVVRLHYHRDQQLRRWPAAETHWRRCLLGQVNAFTIDVQKQVIQPRAHIAEFFIGDDWKVSPRLTLNIGTRYTLNFPSTRMHDQGAVFNLETQVLDFPHTARELECCDFGPRVGLAYRIGDSWVLRSGYGMVFFEQSGITTPFTIPQFPFVQTVGQQSPDNVNAAFALSSGPTVQSRRRIPTPGLGQGVFGVDRHNGSGYSQQWNLTVQKTFGHELEFGSGLPGLEEYAARHTRCEHQPTSRRSTSPWVRRCLTR